MATYAENLQTAKERYALELATGDIKPTYSIGGQSVSWNEYRTSLLEQIERIDALLAGEGGPIEYISEGDV